jgi:glucan biosynthesis protein C
MPEDETKTSRLYFVDNIRWLVIVLVVVLHAAVTYSNMGNWYYKEPADLGLLSGLVFGIILSFTQAYFMGLLSSSPVTSSPHPSTGRAFAGF